MKRRILQIIATLDRSGAEKQLVMLATGLPRDEFDVHVCALTRGGPLVVDLEQQQIPLTVIGKTWKFDPLAFWRLKQHISRLNPDLVQTWMFTANAYGRAAALAAGGRKLVANERGIDHWKHWHQLATDRWLAQKTAAIVVNSPGVQDFYVQQGIPASKFRLIPNGIGPPVASSLSRQQLIAGLGLPPGARLIGAVGRLHHDKRIKDVIWATDLLKVIRDDVHLLIIGDGPQRQTLERFQRACHLEDRVHFLGSRHDVPQLLPHLDVLWMSSSHEGLPNVIMEAMACAVPVVATDIVGNRRLVIHGQTGFLVPIGDRASLARFAHKILENSELAQQLGAAGRQRILTEFTSEAMVERYAALYREILG